MHASAHCTIYSVLELRKAIAELIRMAIHAQIATKPNDVTGGPFVSMTSSQQSSKMTTCHGWDSLPGRPQKPAQAAP